jgi:AcrR family transcriptional regulator
MPRKPTKPSRRNAQQTRSRDTVQVVLDAAAQVLRARGYAGATTNHIAEAAGVSIGTVYQYFATKDDLFDALVEQYFHDVLERVRRQRIDGSVPFEILLRSIISAGIGAQRYGPELMRALDQIPNTAFRRRLADGKRELIRFLREILEVYRHGLRPLDLDRAATLLVHASEGIGFNESADRFNDHLAAELTDVFVRYLSDVQTPPRLSPTQGKLAPARGRRCERPKSRDGR